MSCDSHQRDHRQSNGSMPQRLGLVIGWILLAGVAAAAAWVGISSPVFFRAQHRCELSGTVTSQGRLVQRGTVNFACVMISGDEITDHGERVMFPQINVPIKDGHYAVSDADGLMPGSYHVTVEVAELGREIDPITDSVADGPARHALVEVRQDSRRVLDVAWDL